jgi:hypothetical protein
MDAAHLDLRVRQFVNLASRFLEWAMLPLMLGISLDLFLLGQLILNNAALSAAVASIMFLVFFGLWYVFPWSRKLHETASNCDR